MTEQKKYATFRDLRALPEQKKPDSSTSISSRTSTPSIASTPLARPNTEVSKAPQGIAPERDFQRVPNSITRHMREGLFRGKSKQVWDYLWSVSRGAIIPVRTVRKSRGEIKKGSGLGSMVTVDAAIEHLKGVGLIIVKPSVGSFSGNEYEVFTPEEALSSTSSTSTSSTTSLTQKLDVLDVLDSSISSITQVAENTGTYVPPKTFLNTIEYVDDEAFAKFVRVVRETAREITGKDLSKVDAERLGELAELLMSEFRIAAARTTVSNMPAFLTEHLRRRLWKMDKKQMGAEAKSASADANVKSSAPNEQAKECPDCGGTGFYYPDGFEGGVAKCKHERLKGGK